MIHIQVQATQAVQYRSWESVPDIEAAPGSRSRDEDLRTKRRVSPRSVKVIPPPRRSPSVQSPDGATRHLRPGAPLFPLLGVGFPSWASVQGASFGMRPSPTRRRARARSRAMTYRGLPVRSGAKKVGYVYPTFFRYESGKPGPPEGAFRRPVHWVSIGEGIYTFPYREPGRGVGAP